MTKKINTLVERHAKNKRKLDHTSKNNQNQQQPNKRQNTGIAYTVGHGEKKHYGGSKPLCSKCNYHHDDPCAPKCHKCNRVGPSGLVIVESSKLPILANNQRALGKYYRKFIEGFSKIAKSMTKLTQKGVKFDWGDKAEAAFQLIKQKLCSAPILALPEGSKDFIVY
ncbi:hypothetical protein Tco_1068410 [Tanacetum coccineum]|uniref:Reverse transcriptase domain-containing protein n=1 Tax=Tanacetum coccineum TaxID=301880 RepID=A0ABQ5HHV2_9ASTR